MSFMDRIACAHAAGHKLRAGPSSRLHLLRLIYGLDLINWSEHTWTPLPWLQFTSGQAASLRLERERKRSSDNFIFNSPPTVGPWKRRPGVKLALKEFAPEAPTPKHPRSRTIPLCMAAICFTIIVSATSRPPERLGSSVGAAKLESGERQGAPFDHYHRALT